MRIELVFNSSKVSYPEMALFPLSCVLRRFVPQRTLSTPRHKSLCGRA